MWSRLKPRSIYDVMAVIGCVAAMGTGTAYAANTVFSTDIVDGEVKTADIGTDQVTRPDIQNGAVVGNKLDGSAVTTGKIAPNAVDGSKILDAAIAQADLAADAVNSSKVLDASLTGIDITNSTLTGDDVASSSLTGIDISNSSLTSSDILDETLGTTKIADGGLNTSDLAISSITGSRIAASAVTTSDIANRTVNMDDIDGADRSGSIDVGAISNGRCTTITGSVSGTEPGDAAVLTTNGSIPNGMTITAQRALTDAVHIKVCNLTGATSAAITDLPVRVITFH